MKKLLFILLITTSFCYSQEEKRLALVIGNADYEKGVLKNPVNDAKLIAKALDSLGFEVLEYYNLTTQRQLKKAILEFGAKRDSANVGFVYYAGHGVQVNNENYLLPTQEEYTSQTEVIEYAVSVQSVLRALKSDSNQVNILVLDACRDNPFESNWNKTRSLKGDGLAKIPPPTGSLIAFSTDAGQTAADGEDNNSIYSLSLYKNMLLEDTSLDQVFRNVRADVLKQTNGNQRPVEATQLTGQTFYLNPGNYNDEFKAVALILEQETELTDALNILAPIIDDKPGNLKAQELLAESYIALENFSKALDTYDNLIELDPNNTKYFRQKGFCYASINDLDKALENYNNAVSVEPKNSINYEERGGFYNDYLNNYDKALEDINKGIALNPTDPNLHAKKGYVYHVSIDKPDLALKSYLEVVRLDPNYEVYNNIAKLYENYIKDYQKALEYYTKEIKLNPSNVIAYKNRADLYAIHLQDLDKALEDYNKAVSVEPKNSINYEQRGDFYSDYLNDYDKALEDFNKGIALNPTDPNLHFSKGYLYFELDKPDLALKSYLEVERLDPEYKYINNNIALLYENYIKDYQKALEYFSKEIKLNPSDAIAYTNRAELYASQLQDLDKALEDYNKAIVAQPNSKNFNKRGKFYSDYLNDYDKALEDYNEGIALNPTDPNLHFNKGYLYYPLDKLELALTSYLEVVRLDPEYPYINNNIALLYENYIKDYQKALAYYTKEIKLNPSYAVAYRNRADLYASQLQDLDKALEDYNKAVSVDPKNSINYEKRGNFYSDYLNDYDKALKDYNEGIALNPTDPDLYFNKGYVYHVSLDKPNLALTSYLEVVKLDPNYMVYNNLAGLYENYIKDYQKALEYYTKEIELNPSSSHTYTNRADLYVRKLEDLNKALEDYNSAISVDPKNSINYEKRGDFYQNYLKDFDKAIEDYNEGIALNPKDEGLYFKIAEVYTEYFNKPKLALETLMKMLDFEALETILDSTYLYADIADTYLIYLNDLENSLLFYKKEVERSPQSYYGYFKLAEYYVYNKDYIKAEINYIKALELAPENNNLNLSYINFKYLNASYEDVIQLSKIAIEKDPKDPQGDYITALSYLKMENPMKALMSLTKSIDKIIDYSPEGYYISDLDGSRLDFSMVIMKRAQLYQNYKEFTMMCDDYKFALTFVKDEDLKTVILNKISTECNN